MGVKKVNKVFLWEYFETEKPCFVLILRGRRAVFKARAFKLVARVFFPGFLRHTSA